MMKALRGLFRYTLLFAAIVLLFQLILPAAKAANDISIRHWQVQWIDEAHAEADKPDPYGKWFSAAEGDTLTKLPYNQTGMWVRLKVPRTDGWLQPGFLIQRLYGHKIDVYRDSEKVYSSNRDFIVDVNKMVFPVARSAETSEFLIRIVTLNDRVGLVGGVSVGEFQQLSERFVNRDLPDLLLGTSIAFLAVIMLVCSGFVNRTQRGLWVSLCLVALTTGGVILFYSPLIYIYAHAYGRWLTKAYDVCLFVLLPSFGYYFDRVFEGRFKLFSRFRMAQTGYSAFCLLLLVAHTISDDRYFKLYNFFTVNVLSFFMLVQMVLTVVLTTFYTVKRNRDAAILSFGIVIMALSGLIDLFQYYIHDSYYVFAIWKIGVVSMIASLVIILARRIRADHVMLHRYAKELELFNYKLQRSEKMKIISDLAASVAHEIRNPLQVTRGFLQLLSRQAGASAESSFRLAIQELDRASDIITDFLTFAKPELENVTVLDIAEELKHIDVIMTPLSTMRGGMLTVQAEDGLYINGNSTKFKQAVINMVKNSIEAKQAESIVEIRAFGDEEFVTICIRDNGDGMDEEQIVKLGEPYFSTKSKGTGLGLMVTFRIIEAMKGTVAFQSQKGKGTEAIIRFPLVDKE